MSADPDLLGQVSTNLLINAQQILQDRPNPRRIEIATGVVADEIVIDFRDNGPGVPAELRDRIFEPYFTTKPVGSRHRPEACRSAATSSKRMAGA